MTDYWSGSITFTGLGSDTDFDSVIDALMEVESYRLNRMESWEEQWESKLEIIQELNTAISSYMTALEGMDTLSEFLVKSATSSNESVLTVSADSDALEGTYDIEVNQLAQNDILVTSAGQASTDTVLTDVDTTFSVVYGDETLTITVPAGTTLENLVSRINNDDTMGSDIRASLINDGSNYYLQIRGLDLGADNTVSIQNTGFTGFEATDFERTQTAQNAQIKVDGFPTSADAWIERDSNTISDVIEGVTLNLYDTSAGDTVTLTINTDTDAVIANIESFVEQTNTIRSLIASLDDYDDVDSSVSTDTDDDETDTTFTAVHGNYGVNIIAQTLKDTIASKGLGFSYYDSTTGLGDLYSSLSTIGITTEADEDSEDFGLLAIDYDELEEALEADAEGVAKLFAADNDVTCVSSDMAYDSIIEGMTEPGEYDISYTISGGVIVGATINGNEALIDGNYIVGAQGNPEQGLSVEAINLSDGSFTGTVYIKQGKVNQLLDVLDEMADSQTGILSIIEDSYQEIIDNNEEAMEKEQARLDTKEERLVEKFARLEALLGEYDDISTSLDSQIDSLSD